MKAIFIFLLFKLCGLILTDGSLQVSGSEKEIYEHETDFALDLYRTIASKKQNKNIFVSPISISFCLAMTSLGAKGKTLDELMKVLKVEKPADFHEAMKKLRNRVSSSKGYRLKIASKIFADKSIPLQQSFSDKAFTYYNSRPKLIDFSGKNDAKNKINRWVAKNTDDKITKLINRVESNTKIILANAVYFKGEWMTKFEKSKTKKREFNIGYSTYKKVPTMASKLMKINSTYALDSQFIELPYIGEEVSMYIILPYGKESWNDMEKGLNASFLNSLKFRDSAKIIYMPKFILKDKYNLVSVLKNLGVRDLFSSGKADLTDLTKVGNLQVSEVQHESQIEVNEEGSEASAATAVVVLQRSLNVIYVDRPFLFLIRNKSTGTILFIGKVIDPRKK